MTAANVITVKLTSTVTLDKRFKVGIGSGEN